MSHSLGAKLSGLRHKGYITDDEYLRLKKALEQQPCDDAISRNMALEKMADYVASGYADSAEDFEEYSRIICQLPSITQKSAKDYLDMADRKAKKIKDALTDNSQKYGKWIAHSNGGIWIKYYECSECGKAHDTHSDYCSNCGAKMQEREEA